MAVDVKVPSVGESVQEAQVFKWRVKDGDYIERDAVLLELETDKATVEIVAEAAGSVQVLKKEGESVRVGDVLAKINTDAKKSESAKAVGTHSAPAPATKPIVAEPTKVSPIRTPSPPIPAPGHKTPATQPLSPAVQRMVAEHGLDPAAIQGSGRGGRITKSDLVGQMGRPGEASGTVSPITAGQAAPALQMVERPAQRSTGRPERREPMSLLRRRIAERLLSAQKQAAILTTFNELDMSGVMQLRAEYKDSFKEKHGVSLGFMGFFVKATIEALKAFPRVNGWIDGNDIVYHDYYDMGIAVSSDRGLVVPVLRDADKFSFAAIELQISDFGKRAREGKISVDELSGGTFTISNGGVFGSLLSTPILNPPQSGILGMHKIMERPVVVDGQIIARPMMYVALSYDHRVIDGKEAVSFLVKIKECIEDPARLLLGV